MQTVTAEASSSTVAAAKSIWTKQAQAALARASRVLVYFENPATDAKSWDPQIARVVFISEEVKEKGKPYIPEERVEFEFEGFIRAGYNDEVRESEDEYRITSYESRAYKPAAGTWSFSLHHRDPGVSETALKLVPIGAKVRFEVGLDYLSNGYMAKARLHGDALLAVYTKGKVKGTLLVDTSVGPLNSVRFGATAR